MSNTKPDIDYFCERSLSSVSVSSFGDNLPGHLAEVFKKSINVADNCANTLQGYGGPPRLVNNACSNSEKIEPVNGVEIVKFWYGASANFNAIPVLGSIGWGVTRLVQSAQGHLDWSYLYFDAETGEILSHEQNEAAEKLFKKGLEFFNNNEFEKAAEYFNYASKFCKKDYYNEEKFRQYRDKANAQLG